MPRVHGAAETLPSEAAGGGPMAGTGECATWEQTPVANPLMHAVSGRSGNPAGRRMPGPVSAGMQDSARSGHSGPLQTQAAPGSRPTGQPGGTRPRHPHGLGSESVSQADKRPWADPVPLCGAARGGPRAGWPLCAEGSMAVTSSQTVQAFPASCSKRAVQSVPGSVQSDNADEAPDRGLVGKGGHDGRRSEGMPGRRRHWRAARSRHSGAQSGSCRDAWLGARPGSSCGPARPPPPCPWAWRASAARDTSGHRRGAAGS